MTKRIQFFIKHLTLSFIIALVVLGVVFYCWYPTPLAKAVGVTDIILMLFAIDIIVGPLLGLLVYKEHKKTLKFDLIVIILIQISALMYGIYSLEQGRPAWIVYNVDRFELVRKNEIINEHIEKAQPQYKHPSLLKPQYVMVEVATDIQKRQADLFTEVLGGVSLSQMPDRYIEFDNKALVQGKNILNIRKLYEYNEALSVRKILDDSPTAVGFVPLKASQIDMTVLLDAQGKPLAIVDLRPWN